MACPHHYVLTGDTKERIPYNQLKPTQSMAGALKAVINLPRKQKDKKITYPANLMEDASDFGFQNACACHAVDLTTMEADNFDLLDTDG